MTAGLNQKATGRTKPTERRHTAAKVNIIHTSKCVARKFVIQRTDYNLQFDVDFSGYVLLSNDDAYDHIYQQV